MEEFQSSDAAASHPTNIPTKKIQDVPAVTSRVKVGCLSAATSLQESFRYVKAVAIGQVKKLTAKNEKESTEADLVTAKMQVEAADAAELTKKQLIKYS